MCVPKAMAQYIGTEKTSGIVLYKYIRREPERLWIMKAKFILKKRFDDKHHDNLAMYETLKLFYVPIISSFLDFSLRSKSKRI